MTIKALDAADFINNLRTMPSEKLSEIIYSECGEELAQFFLNYSTKLISQSKPEDMVKNVSSLMLMGYLIRGNESKVTVGTQTFVLPKGQYLQ